MIPNLNNLDNEANSIIRWIKRYTDESGFPIKEYGSISGEHLINDNILDDLGDYLPFIAYLSYKDFCEGQLEGLYKKLESGDLKFEETSYGFPIVPAFKYSDLLLGVTEYISLTDEETYSYVLNNILEQFLDRFYTKGRINSFYIPHLNRTLPIYDTVDSMFIELFSDIYELNSEYKFLEMAVDLKDELNENSFYQKYNLFPRYYPYTLGNTIKILPPINKKTRWADFMKSNTSAIYSLLRHYELTEDETSKNMVENWFTGYNTYFKINDSSLPAKTVKIKDGRQTVVDPPNLLSGFSAIDLLCDCTYVLDDNRFLAEAEKVGEIWLKEQSNETGLFPMYPSKKESHLDSETDMAIALNKLYELTGKNKFKKSADAVLEGIIKHHKEDHGYPLSVDIMSGETQDSRVIVKYQALLLKLFILYTSDKTIYWEGGLKRLLRDR